MASLAVTLAKKMEFPHCFVKAQVVEQLLKSIRKSMKENRRATTELDILWNNCCEVTNNELGYMCANGIVRLAIEGFLDKNKVISTAVNYASSAKDISCLLSVIEKLLLYISSNAGDKLTCPYNLRAPPHPFISVISSRPNSWLVIQSHIECMLNSGQDTSSQISMIEIFKPVIVYILLNPLNSDEVTLCKQRLIRALVEKATTSEFVQQEIKTILWHTTMYCDDFSIFESLIQLNFTDVNITLILLKILRFCHSENEICRRRIMLALFAKIFQATQKDNIHFDVICVAISLILNDLPMSVCDDALAMMESFLKTGSGHLSHIHLFLTMATLLQFKLMVSTSIMSASTSVLLTKLISDVGKEIRKTTANSKIYKNDVTSTQVTDVFITKVFSINSFLMDITDNPENVMTYLNSLTHSKDLPMNAFLLNTLLLYSMNPDESTISHKVLGCMSFFARKHARLSYTFLPVLIYSIRNASEEIVKRICCILPDLASHTYCIMPVLNIIKALAAEPSLKALSLRLMLDLWKRQDRCYPQLQEMLLSVEISTVRNKSQSYDFNLMKAIVVAAICRERPHQYGSDMLKLINRMLSSSDRKCDQLIMAFALEGLCYLCSSKSLNMVTMWNQLGDTLQGKTNSLVLRKVLDIVSLLPNFKNDSSEYQNLNQKLICWAWSKVLDKDVVTAGSALRCLAQFEVYDHKVRCLPSSLRPDKSEEVTEEEYAEKPVPGYTFLKLLLGADHELLNDCLILLKSVLQQELQSLPRDIHHRAMKTQLQMSQPKPLKAIPEYVLTFYERNKQPTMKSSLAFSLLLSYSSNPEVDSSGNIPRKSLVIQSRRCMDLLQTLLKEVTIDQNDWQSLLWCAHGWKTFIRRCMEVMVEGRRAEIEMQQKKKVDASEDVEDDLQHKHDTALYWCRDRITNALKSASKGKPSMQGNAVFALSSLIIAANSLENSGDESQDIDTEYIKMAHWSTMAIETLMSIANPKYIPSGRIMSWCQYRAVSSTGKLSTTQLGKICAIHALPFVTRLALQKHSGKILEMLGFLQKADPDSLENLEFHRLLSLGNILGVLFQENAVEHFDSNGSLFIEECLKMLHERIKKCLGSSDHLLQNNLGALIGFGLAASSKFHTSDSSFNVMGRQFLLQILQHLKLEELSPDCVQATATVLTWTCLSGFTNKILDHSFVKQLTEFLHTAVMDDPSKSGYCESLGSLCNGLFLSGDTTILDMMNKLFEQWLSIVQKRNVPTREKLAALAGLCALVGSNTTISPVMVDPNMLSASHYISKLSQVVKILRQYSQSSKDPGVPSRSVILLGHLYMSMESSTKAIGSIQPASYDYLPSTSVLRYLFSILTESFKSGSKIKQSTVNIILNCISSNSKDSVLPPVNWAPVVLSIISGEYHDDIKTSAVSIILSQCSHSSSCGSLLTSLSSPSKITHLSTKTLALLFKNFDKIISNTEDAKIAELLDFFASTCISYSEQDNEAELCIAILDGFLKSLKISKKFSISVQEMMHNTVDRLFCNLPFNLTSQLQVDLMTKVAFCAEMLPDANSLVAKFEEKGSSSKDCLRSLFLRCCCTMSGSHSLNMCNNVIFLCGNNSKTHEESLWIISTCLSGVMKKLSASKQIEWLKELMAQIKRSVELFQEDYDSVEYLMNIFSIAVCIWSSSDSTLSIQDKFDVQLLKHVCRVVENSFLMLPVSLSRLFKATEWEKTAQAMIDWLSFIIEKLRDLHPESKRIYQLINCIGAVRNTNSYQLPSVWCKVVSTVCHLK